MSVLCWEDHGRFYLETHPQGTSFWLKAREGRITGTSFAEQLGEVMKEAKLTPEEEAAYVEEMQRKYGSEWTMPTPEAAEALKQEYFAMGHMGEAAAAAMYAEELPEGHKLIEVGLAVYKKNQALSASPDRIVIDETGKWIRIVEFKTSSTDIYFGLKNELISIAAGNKPQPAYEVLDRKHFWQMQLQMFVTGVYEMDYVVYAPNADKLVIYSINFSWNHWRRIQDKISKITQPLLDKLQMINL